jgi:hypothetical protein
MGTKTKEEKAAEQWVEWNPGFARHVRGRYTVRVFDPETGLPEPQRIEVRCLLCGDTWQGTCLSGQVRTHIARFGAVHAHRDPLEASRVVRPGSLRVGGGK